MSVHEIGIDRNSISGMTDQTQGGDDYFDRKKKQFLKDSGYYETLTDWKLDAHKSGAKVDQSGDQSVRRYFAKRRGTIIGVFHEGVKARKDAGYLLSPKEMWERGLFVEENQGTS